MNAPIAQLDRVSAYEAAGSPFEPGWARQLIKDGIVDRKEG